MKYLFFLIFIFTVIVKTDFNESNIFCKHLNENIELFESKNLEYDNEFIKTLFDWCLSDIGCKRLYFQEPKKNITLFQIMIKSFTNNIGNNLKKSDILKHTLCNETDDINTLYKNLWLSKLKSDISSHKQPVYCDQNHKTVYDPITSVFNCVCLEDHVCSDALFPTTWTYIVFVLLIVFAVLFFISICYRNYIIIKSTIQITNSNKGNPIEQQKKLIKIFNDIIT